jgi:hypothetical protein
VILALVVDVQQVKRVDVAREVPQDGQADVDQQVGAAAGDEEDCYRWDWRGRKRKWSVAVDTSGSFFGEREGCVRKMAMMTRRIAESIVAVGWWGFFVLEVMVSLILW